MTICVANNSGGMEFNMKLYSKTFLLLIGIIIIPLIIGIAFTYTNIKASINDLEIEKGKDYCTSANQYINFLVKNQGDSYFAWTLWTDYYNAVANKDLDWIKDNVLSSAKDDSSSEVIITLNNDGSVLAECNAPKDWTGLNFKEFDLFNKLSKDVNFASGVEETSEGLYIATIVKLVKTEDDRFQDTNGFTVYARKIKNNLLIDSKTMIGADVALKLDNGELLSTGKSINVVNSNSKSFDLNQAKTYTKIVGDTMKIQAEQAFLNSSGNPIGILHIEANSKSGVLSLNKLEKNSIILMIILILAVILVCYLMVRTILKPLSLIVKEIEMMADGDLSTVHSVAFKYYVSLKDEIGQLARAIVSMKNSLSEMIADIKNSSTHVANFSAHMAEAAEASGKATEQIAAATHTLAEGASQQNSHVTTIQQQIEETVVKTDEGLRATNQMFKTAKVATEVAVTARNYMQEVTEQFDVVNKTVEFATESIQNLDKRSGEISEFMEVIIGISSQTNLLALNASIEAARAGEYGRGFAIVAEEIRKLSERTAEETNKITELILDIHEETSGTVKAMESNCDKINLQIDAIKKGGESLNTIVINVQETEMAASAIYDIYSQIQKMTATINSLVNEISGVIDDSVAHSQEIAASSEEQSSSMEKITANAAELAVLAEKLHEKVIQFKTT